MELLDWLSVKRGRLASLSKKIGAHPPDVSRWATKNRPIPMRFGPLIERETGHEVTRQEMFPDNWRELWPELADESGSPNTLGAELAAAPP